MRHPSAKRIRASRPAPRALTLIEMLIGMAITLVMMAAVVNLFANLGSGVRVQRAAMEMSSQLRTTRARLFMDLAGATCAPRPKLPTDDHDDGYIEIVEGVYSDKNPSGVAFNPAISQIPSSNLQLAAGNITDGLGLGDYDDILALTVRSENEPFIGRADNTSIESNLAEVIWFAVENPADDSLGEPGMRTVYRRVLLIAPWIDPIDPTLLVPLMADPADPSEFFRRFDISARYDETLMKWIPNTLANLVKRENRFGHFVDSTAADNGFPHEFLQTAIIPNVAPPAFPTGSLSPLHPFGLPFEWDSTDPDPANPTIPPTPNRQGEDLMLNDVLAFDVRVFDSGVPLVVGATNIILEATDQGWFEPTSVADVQGYGSYVDLGWWPTYGAFASAPTPLFQDRHLAGWHPISSPGTGYPAVYDTWSYHYENDNLDQDGDGIFDQGTNGLDDNNINGTDDVAERETSPPYDVPLRGIQVKLRVYEPDTRQIREATVTRGLVPQ